MASRQDARRRREMPRLCLFTEIVGDGMAFARVIAPALTAADIAAVILKLAPGDEASLLQTVRALAPAIQKTGAALLLDGDADLAVRAGADGAHLTGREALTAALPVLKPARIAGAGGLRSRHDAMLAGEAGADYVLFGEPEGSDRRPPFAAVIERVSWWAEVFEVPCMGFASDLQQAGELAAAGADFVALGDFVWKNDRGPTAAVASAAERLRSVELV